MVGSTPRLNVLKSIPGLAGLAVLHAQPAPTAPAQAARCSPCAAFGGFHVQRGLESDRRKTVLTVTYAAAVLARAEIGPFVDYLVNIGMVCGPAS